MSDEINELTSTVNSFIRESSERSVRLETITETLVSNVASLASNVEKTLQAQVRTETQLTSLEIRAINRLDKVEELVGELEDKHDLLDKRVQTLELINAHEQGVGESNEKNHRRRFANWQWALGTITTLAAVATFVFQFLIKGSS